MSSILKVDTIQDQSGNNIINESGNVITIGASGDTITVPAGATVSGFTSAGIDDNATSVAITIDSSERVGLNTTTPGAKLEINSTGSYYNTANQHQQWSYNGTPFLSLYMDAYASPYFDTDSASSWNPGATMVFKRQGSEKFRITSTGLVGIGTSAPSATVGTDKVLEIAGSTSPGLIINDTGQAEKYQLYADSTKFKMNYGSTNFLTYDASNSNLGVGTTSPGTALEVVGTGVNGIELGQQSDGNDSSRLFFTNSSNVCAIRSTGGSLKFSTGATINSSSGDDRVTITSAGNLGIGTSSPSQKLHVEGSGTTNAIVKSTGSATASAVGAVNNSGTAGKILMYGSSQGAYGSLGSGQMALYSDGAEMSIMNDNSNGAIKFSMHSGSEKMRIDSSGNVGIGTSAPSAKLELSASNSSGTANALRFTDTDTGTTANQKFGAIQFNSSDSGNTGTGGAIDAISEDFDANTAIRILTGAPGSASERMRITSAGKVLINTTVSDNGNVVSSGNGTSGSTACYGLVRGSYKSTLGMDSVGGMNIRNFSGEIYVTDGAGNTTTISPHNFSVIPDGASEDLAWSYYTRKGDVENDFDNTKYISADITKVIRKVENLTGDKLIYSGTGSTDDGSTVSQNIIQELITRIESLEAEVTALKNQP